MIPDDPHKGILNRQESAEHIKKHFQPTVNLLREMVDYGTNLIVRCYEISEEKDYKDVVLLGALLKHAVAMLDAIEILISEGAVFSAHVQARSLFETWLYIKWILDKDTKSKCLFYFVWQIRQNLLWAKRNIDGSQEQQFFYDSIGDFKEVFESKNEDKQKNIKSIVESLENLLNSSDLKEANKVFEKQKKESGKDIEWFKPFKVSDRSVMAKDIKAEAQYRIFYNIYSEVVHANVLQEHVQFQKQSITFTPIRHLEGIDSLLAVVLTFVFEIYTGILDHYRPSELMNFKRKYIQEWRQRFLSIKTVNYNIIEKPLNL